MKHENDPFIWIDNVFAKFNIIKWKQWYPDYPYYSMSFNDNWRHYKINFKGTPLPKVYYKLRSQEGIVEKAHAIKTPFEAALFVIEQFWFAVSEMSESWVPPFKVIVSEQNK